MDIDEESLRIIWRWYTLTLERVSQLRGGRTGLSSLRLGRRLTSLLVTGISNSSICLIPLAQPPMGSGRQLNGAHRVAEVTVDLSTHSPIFSSGRRAYSRGCALVGLVFSSTNLPMQLDRVMDAQRQIVAVIVQL